MKSKLLLICCLLINISLFAQPQKVVELVVVGTGVTAESALQNAFKKAIEQSFGTFISTKTEILNDEITKNELVSVSNGNIQNYEVLSTAKLNEKEFSTTVKVVVSISNLVSFVKSKGISAEIKGSLLSANILQQEFNEANELKATKELINTLTGILNKSFDYSVKIDEPTKGAADFWNIPLTASVQPNENIKIFKQFLLKSLAGISMTPSEAANYLKLKKPVYKVAIGDEQYFEGNGVSKNLFYVDSKLSLIKNATPKIAIDKVELKKLAELKDKKYYICYSADEIDTMMYTTTSLTEDINKFKDGLNEEALSRLKDFSEEDFGRFRPYVYWTKNDFVPPVYYFRNRQSLDLLRTLLNNTLKDILFDITIKNEIKTIKAPDLYQSEKNERSARFKAEILDNNFKLSFNAIYHEVNSVELPVRLNYFSDQSELGTNYNLSGNYFILRSFDLSKYLNLNNRYKYLKRINSNGMGTTTDKILINNFQEISYPFLEFMKFSNFVNAGTKVKIVEPNGFKRVLSEDAYDLVSILDSFKENKLLYSFKYIDKVSKDDLSKISNYIISHN